MMFAIKRILFVTLLILTVVSCRTISSLKLVGEFDSGLGEGAAEIIAYDASVSKAFVVNAEAGTVDVLVVAEDGSLPSDVASHTIDVSLAMPGVALGNANSVATMKGVLAVAIENANKQANGVIALYSTHDYRLLSSVEVGALPDMVKFTPDGKRIIVANEGEPSDDYKVDPEGSISIISIGRENSIENPRVHQISFSDFNEGGPRHSELPAGLRVFGPGASVAQDLEPEYVAVSADSKTAWVGLQENNGIAVIDLKKQVVREIIALGFKVHNMPGNELDASNRDERINIQNWPVKGMYQPDSIDAYQYKGETYIVTANEGDARDYWADAEGYSGEADCRADGGLDWDSEDGCLFFSEEVRVKDLNLDPVVFNQSDLQDNDKLGRLKTTTTLGDANHDGYHEEIYSYGARSFSIWDSRGRLVFDSGADIANITADLLGLDLANETGFNAGDDRSDDKGAEPESIVVGYVDGRNYAFVGLERTGGILVYDITDPSAVEYILYLNEGPKHISPEGLAFVSKEKSPTDNALLMVAHEISGTSTVYEIITSED